MGKSVNALETSVRNTRKRAVKDAPVAIKEKFVEQRLSKIVEITPKTENQKLALDGMKKKQVMVLRGKSGTGKSYLACIHAANEYLRGHVKKIVLIRPYEHLSRSIGLRPGTGEEKLRPLMQSMLQNLEKVFGKAELEAKISAGNIVLEALEDCRGRSYANSFIVVDEAQNIDIHAMKALLTRLEDSSQLVLCGDGAQKDIKALGGIDWISDTMDKIRKFKPTYLDEQDMNQAYNNFGVVTFNTEDIVRGGFTRLMVKIFDEESV